MNSQIRCFKPCRDNIRSGVMLALLTLAYGDHASAAIAQSPLYLGQSSAPLILFNMARDHKLYYEAYNDASDINGDGVLDIRYSPSIDYYGYFDSHKCYSYSSGVFQPVATTTNKQCSGSASGRWSGDYLNYLTMSRMDALRRVLYGGRRSTDSGTETILERSFIPQDAHSWGKEYTSTAVDGYNIADYTPLSQPATNTRHLFANTTLLCPTGNTDPGCSSNTALPLLRVLINSTFRVWEWLSIERPVAGVQCATGNNSRSNCAVAGGDVWFKVPSSYFSGLTQTTYDITGSSVSSPSNHTEYNTMVSTYAINSKKFGSGTASSVDGMGNPYGTQQDQYLTIFQGSLAIPASEAGSFTFAPTGDDAVEVLIDGTTVAGWYGGHGDVCDDTCKNSHAGTITLTAGSHTIEYRHQEWTGGDSYYLWMKRTLPASTMTDYVVRVRACVSGLLESECRQYPTNSPTVAKPSGILQEYGENNRMAFGLFTGSYEKNTSGGVLRKNISYLADSNFSSDQEINTSTGQFTSTNGIIKTLDKLKIVDFGGNYYYNSGCGVPEVNAPLAEGQCRMWGNPAAEMMYEGLRYFAGKSGPSSAFSIAASGNDDKDDLDLPLPSWQNPYRTTTGGFPSCSRPSQIVVSDINPSYDTDKVPGSYFATYSGDLGTLNVSTLASTIWTGEYGSATPSLFIGQSGTTYDGAPTPKTVNNFNNIRGLSPEEPTKEGGYYEGSVALYGRTNDLNAVSGNQKTDTYSIALSSPLPRIELPVNGHIVTLVPFGKTVGGCSGGAGGSSTAFSSAQGSYQPTNTIVDFYVDTLKNTAASNTDTTVNGGRAYAKFRINYEDSEYGSDHDMDAIVEYELTVQSNGTVDVKLTSGYAAGGCIQHMGYVISGTTADGSYLEVRDSDTGSGSDVDYFLDTPNTSSVALPLQTTRTFTPGATASASFVAHDPLWYAAKWGGFIDANGNNQLDTGEWDVKAPTGTPDTYFLVTNASKLKEQLDNAFSEITSRNSSASSVATNSTSVGTDTLIYQARFNSGDWSGQLRAFYINTDGSIGSVAWDTLGSTAQNSSKFNPVASRKIYSYNPAATGSKGIAFCWDAANCFTGATAYLSATQKTALSSVDIVNYLRGDQSKETTQTGGTYRARTTLLGDIVNSDPWYAGTQSFGYENLPGSEGSSYITFRTNTAAGSPAGISGRRAMIYVGANDGMLHAFDATNSATVGGDEIFAYVASSVISSNLTTLSAQGYTHQYFVDGSPKVGDVYYSGAWHSVLVGTTGAGGKGVFALDVTDPDSFDQSKVLWEFTSSNDTDLGYTMSQASIVRMANGKFAAVFGNGYESTGGKSVLFILDISDGSVIKKIVVDTSGSNGLSTPIAVDVDNDRIVDYIYAGDLKGNLWKFDVSDNSDTNWGVAYSGLPLYVAKDKTTPTAVIQPITVKPQVGRASASGQAGEGVMVYFGTGKYFEVGDNILPTSPTTPQVQSFYGIWDECDKAPPSPLTAATCDAHFTGRTALVAQTIDQEGIACLVDTTVTPPACSVNNTSTSVRVTSSNSVAYAFDSPGMRGWFLDLQQPPTPTAQGERVFSNPLLRGSKIIFTTLVPGSNPCDFGGNSWLMEFNASTGQRLPNSGYDINGDGTVNGSDNVFYSSYNSNQPVTASGVQSTVGIIKTPTLVTGTDSGGGCNEFKIVSGSTGELASIHESCSEPSGRMSWRQLR